MAENVTYKQNAGKQIGNYNLALCRDVTDRSDKILLDALGLSDPWDDIELEYFARCAYGVRRGVTNPLSAHRGAEAGAHEPRPVGGRNDREGDSEQVGGRLRRAHAGAGAPHPGMASEEQGVTMQARKGLVDVLAAAQVNGLLR